VELKYLVLNSPFLKGALVLTRRDFKILWPDYRPPPLGKEESNAKRISPVYYTTISAIEISASGENRKMSNYVLDYNLFFCS
jgi:hypothetical protein